MDTATAASYLAIGESSFRIVAARAGITPVELGLAVTRWRRTDLDTLVDKLPTRGADCAAPDQAEIDPIEDALARVRRRRGRTS